MKEASIKMYLIAIVLPQPLNERILSYKNFMLERFDCKVGLKSPAHITIIPPFWMEDEKEIQLFNDIDNLSSGIASFQIATNDFSAFKPRTIFIDVKPNKQLNSVKQSTDKFFKQRPEYKAKIENRPFHPHITIATRDLHKKAFYEAWPLFQNKNFEEEWTAKGMAVLRHNGRNWDVICTSSFAQE
jgi:2'-5' RNA ligase